METITTKTQTDEYKIVQSDKSEFTRWANIIFINNEFDSCKYELEYNSVYNYEDWIFLKQVALKIEKLQKLYNK